MTTCAHCTAPLEDDAVACASCLTPRPDPKRTAVASAAEELDGAELIARVRLALGDHYEVHAELGRGGMAVVYKATELELLRPVALKVLPPELAVSPAMAERFKREARMAASFDHPNIIPIYRIGQLNGVFFIAMKFIEGRPLDAILDSQGALPIPVVMHVLRAAVRALAFAHQNNVVHRDIKGANILIDQDARVVVSDFGIARASEDAGLTATGAMMGTPYFMSPEQCAGHRVGQQSDQYSLGIVAFQMLTGTVPFRAETIPGVMQHHFFTPVPDIREVRKDVPDALMKVVTRALAKRPSERYATTREMQDALESLPFGETERRAGEAMLRDLVLGVAVPRVDAGVLPPLAETLLMTPPPLARQRLAKAERRGRWRTVAAAALGASVVGGLGYGIAAARSREAPPAVADSARPIAAAPALAVAALDSATARRPEENADRRATSENDRGVPPRVQDTAGASDQRDRSIASGRSASPVAEALAGPPGKIRIRAYPTDAEILLDGRLLGRGVVVDSAVASGRRRLRIVAPGYRTIDTTVTVPAGETAQLGTLRLVPDEVKP